MDSMQPPMRPPLAPGITGSLDFSQPLPVIAPVAAVSSSPLAAPVEDDDEYDPFSTEPQNGSAPRPRNHREAMPEIDALLLGESSGFFDTWQNGQPSSKRQRNRNRTASRQKRALQPPAIAGFAQNGSVDEEAPWARRRRTFDVRSPEAAAATTVAPQVPMAFGSSWMPTVIPQPTATPMQRAITVDLIDSDDEAKPAAVASQAVPALSPAVPGAGTAIAAIRCYFCCCCSSSRSANAGCTCGSANRCGYRRYR